MSTVKRISKRVSNDCKGLFTRVKYNNTLLRRSHKLYLEDIEMVQQELQFLQSQKN